MPAAVAALGPGNRLTSRVITRTPTTRPPPTSMPTRLSGRSSRRNVPQPSHLRVPRSSVRPQVGQPNAAVSVPPPAIGSAKTPAFWSAAYVDVAAAAGVGGSAGGADAAGAPASREAGTGGTSNAVVAAG